VQPSAPVHCKALTIALLRYAIGPSVTCVETSEVVTLARDGRWDQPQEYAFELAAQSASWSHEGQGFRSLWQLDARAVLESGADIVASLPLEQALPSDAACVAVECGRPAQREWAAEHTSVAFLSGVLALMLGSAALSHLGYVQQSWALKAGGGVTAILLAVFFVALLRARKWEARIGRPQVVVATTGREGRRDTRSGTLSCKVWLVERSPIAAVRFTLVVRWLERSKSTQARSAIRRHEQVAWRSEIEAKRSAPDEWQALMPLPATTDAPCAFLVQDRNASANLLEVGAHWELLVDVDTSDGGHFRAERELRVKPTSA